MKRIIFLLCMFMVFTLSVLNAQNEASEEQLCEKYLVAKNYCEAKDFNSAIRIFSEIGNSMEIAMNSSCMNFHEYFLLYVEATYFGGQYELSIKLCELWIKTFSEYVSYQQYCKDIYRFTALNYYYMGIEYSNGGNRDEAIVWYKKVESIYSKYENFDDGSTRVFALQAVAGSYFKKKDYTMSAGYYKEAVHAYCEEFNVPIDFMKRGLHKNELLHSLLFSYSVALYSAGDRREAKKIQKLARKCFPSSF